MNEYDHWFLEAAVGLDREPFIDNMFESLNET